MIHRPSTTPENHDASQPLALQALRLMYDARVALLEMPVGERLIHLFWLSGPLILLVERTPADIWLSLLALAFVVRSVVKSDGAWLGVWWVRSCFLFLLVCIVSSLFSALPGYALQESLIWFRFPVFAMATVFWFAQDKRLLYAMIFSTGIGMMVMTGILTVEMIVEGQKGGRLTWPYDDLVPGNYLSKVGLPAFTIMVAIAIGGSRKIAGFMALTSLITIVLSVLTGERINFLIRACGGMLAGLVWRPRLHRLLFLVLIEVAAVAAMFFFVDGLQSRFVTEVVAAFPTSASSDYYRVMGAGLAAFHEAPVLGVGPAAYRDLCPELVGNLVEFRCDNHPHNFYVQFLAETGSIGFLAGVLMIGSILCQTLLIGIRERQNVVTATAFIIPLGLFFPIASMGDFFGQWNNIFLWSAVALSLAACNIGRKKQAPEHAGG
ncbi:MAG: O-antigen ligase family protein [Pseudomonadota bacterium]|nr:O-antigen ligase family protein [Pseudomonadota bacterium]